MPPFALAALIFAPLVPDIAASESAHAVELAAHRHEAPRARRLRLAALGRPEVDRVVYGYYPYWVSAWDSLQFELLTHLAYFSIEVNPDGTLGDRHGWPDTAFVETGHSHGLIVEVCFTLFGGADVSALISSRDSRARAISAMIDEMEAGGADGIDVDFEDLSSGSRDRYTTFVHELRDALIARDHPDATLSLAIPAVDWSDNFDLDAMSRDVNLFFIMGYGYHWSGSSRAGPVGQLRVTDAWAAFINLSMQKSIAHYTALVSPQDRSRIVYGVPYYGYEWPVESVELFAATTGRGTSRTYAAARRGLESGRVRRFEAGSANPWQAFSSSGDTRQLWYDDEESLAAKYRMVLDQEIGGAGMWALGYDEAYPELWGQLRSTFANIPEPRVGSRWRPKIIDEIPFVDSSSTSSTASSYFNYYSCRPGVPEYGREVVYGFTTCASGRLTASVTDADGVDIDLHLLLGPDEDSCLVADDRSLEEDVGPGRYYLVADSYVAGNVPQEGEYRLDVDFEAAGPGCSTEQVCVRGRCRDHVPTSTIGDPLDWGTGKVPPVAGTRGRSSEEVSPAPRPPRDRTTDLPSEGDQAHGAEGCGCHEVPEVPGRATASGAFAALCLGALGWVARRARKRCSVPR